MTMIRRARIDGASCLRPVDSVPRLGGWLTTDQQHAALAGVSVDEFWADPTEVAIRAYRNLDVDGLMGLHLPQGPGLYRGPEEHMQKKWKRQADEFPSVEHALDHVKTLPQPESLAKTFDDAAFEQDLTEHMVSMQGRLGDIVWMPARWRSTCNFRYGAGTFGHVCYYELIGLYPDWTRKLYEYLAEEARLQNEVVARVYDRLDCPKVVLTGHDICSSAGPVVSPGTLDKLYWPSVAHSLKPLLDADFKLIWHSDGNVLPIVDSIIDVGFAGFQGFQEELGGHIGELVKRRAKDGGRLLFFGSVSVSATLPHGTADEVREAVTHSIEMTNGLGLFILPANTINPDVPLENIRAMYDRNV